ncbi:MAG: HlyD family efflux transporter periplasmic adaptor subunit [Candidatus Magasanikbacteria bacterium]|nr:HlyD family efflux transporter periplasmic adaptor subunit [Candidatus Magasanikbacteria bacterium]
MAFFKSKKFIVISAIILIIGGLVVYSQYKKANTPIVYDTVKAVVGTIKQTVEATGKIQSANDLSLRFEISGTVGEVKVIEGSVVKANDILMRLKTADLDAAVAQASANLNQRLAGATKEDISYYQSAADLAKASLDQAIADGAHSISSAESAVETAKNNLKLAEGGDNSEIVSNAYENAVGALQSSLSTMDNSLTQADNILGIDNPLANDDIEQYLSIKDTSKLPIANLAYSVAKLNVASARSIIIGLTTQSQRSLIDDSLDKAEIALSSCAQLLINVKDTLVATTPAGSITQAILDSKKTTIETARSAAGTQYNSIISQRQQVSSAKNSYNTYLIAYNRALSDLENTKKSAQSNIDMKDAAYKQAQANLAAKINPPREVDVAAYRAALSQAIANRDKAIMRAPIDGMVTKIYKKKGEFASMSEVALELLSPHFEIDVDIPETDVVKLKLQDTVIVTLDAYGDDVKFSGKVISIDPASTDVQDVVYYKVKVALDDSDREIKSGMTANVTVSTASRDNALYIPFRAVRTNSQNEKFVRVLVKGAPQDTTVKLGLRADDGQVEILEGLKEGDEIILSVQGQ